jgi:peptidoglycan/LPS O-acetylase OafA/YrhL
MFPSTTVPASLPRPEKRRRVASDPYGPASPAEEKLGYRPDVDGLRFVAVGLVVLGHSGLLFSGGFVGVDVFFVISGFLITRLIVSGFAAGTLTLKQFWMRRVRRILPAAAVVVAATLIAGMILLRPRELAALAESAIAQQFCLANVYFWAQGGYFDLPSSYKPLLHTWSLAVEEQFYLIWPLVLILVCRWGKKATGLAIGGLGVVSLAISEMMVRTHPSAAFYFMPPRMWELLLGALVLYCPQWSLRKKPLFGLAGLVLIMASAVTYTSKTPLPGLMALVPCMGTALIIFAPAVSRLSVTKLLSIAPVVYVGKASYSIYLWHWPLFVFSKMFFGKDFSFAAQAGVVLASLAIGSLSYEVVEMPIRSRRWLAGNKQLVLCCGLGAIFICSTACSIHSYLTFKYPEVALGPLPTESCGDPGPLGQYRRFGACCRILGDPKNKNFSPAFVLWGDSHAKAIAILCDDLARSRGLCGRCFAYPGVTPLLGAWSKELLAPEEDHESSRRQLSWSRDVIEWINNNRVRDVIVAGRWDLLTRNSPVVPADSQRTLDECFHETISALESSGARVWLLMQVPAQNDDPLARSSKGVTKQDYLAQQYWISRLLKSPTAPGLTVIGPGGHWFDRHGYSLKADVGGAFYADDNHVNRYGSQKLISPLLEPVFDRIKKDLRARKQRPL